MKPRRSSLVRRRVFERDQGYCATCGQYDPRWQHDHVIALWEGGRDDLENSQTLCHGCHQRKTVKDVPIRAKTDRLKERHDMTKRRREIRVS